MYVAALMTLVIDNSRCECLFTSKIDNTYNDPEESLGSFLR